MQIMKMEKRRKKKLPKVFPVLNGEGLSYLNSNFSTSFLTKLKPLLWRPLEANPMMTSPTFML